MSERDGVGCVHTTDVITIDALKLFEKVVFCEVFLSSRRKYSGTSMFKTVSKPLAHLNFLSGVNCYDIGSMGYVGHRLCGNLPERPILLFKLFISQGLGMQFKFGGTKYHLKLNIGGTDSAQVP